VAEVTVATFYTLIGASGFVKMMAASARAVSIENAEGPTILIALTFAYTPTPQSRLKGSALRVAIGTAHVLTLLTAGLFPSQLSVSVVYVVLSFFLISIL
jgi:hypothetical protein